MTAVAGLQRQRTVMAWRRTWFAAAVVGLGVLRLGLVRRHGLDLLAAVAVCAGLGALLAVSARRRRLLESPGDAPPVDSAAVAWGAGCVTWMALWVVVAVAAG